MKIEQNIKISCCDMKQEFESEFDARYAAADHIGKNHPDLWRKLCGIDDITAEYKKSSEYPLFLQLKGWLP